jgi:tetratricopeptide (TPR) repeat protein
LVLTVVFPTTRFSAGTAQELAAGDRVLITASLLPVYLQLDASSPSLIKLSTGQLSRFIKTQQDGRGVTWTYLADGANGWVQGVVDAKQGLIPFSDEAVAQQVLDATASINADPKNTDAYVMRGNAYNSQGNYEAALGDFTQAIAIAPKEGARYRYRGSVELETRDYDKAISDFNRAVKLGDKSALIYDLLGITYSNEQELDYALSYINQAITLAPQFGTFYIHRASAYRRQKQYSKAIQEATQAIQLDPLLARAYRERAKNYYIQQQYDPFLQDINKAIEINPGCSDCLVDRGAYSADVLHDIRASFRDFDQAVKVDPLDSYALGDRGATYIQLGDPEAALQDLTEAARLDPKSDFITFNLATAQAITGNYEAAATTYSKSIESGGQNSASALLYRPQVYIALGRYDDAVVDIGKYLDIFGATADSPGFNTAAYLVRATARLYKGDYALAGQDYDDAVKTYPDFALNYVSYGRGYWVTPKREFLIIELQQKVGSNPKDSKTQLQLGQLYMEFGRWPEGLAAYKAYLNLEPNPELQKLVDKLTTTLQ